MNTQPEAGKRRAGVAAGSCVDAEQQTNANRSTEEPEHRSDRRRFLIWACMAGLIGPERVTERILAEVADSPLE